MLKRKSVVWLLVTALLALVLVLPSCSGDTTTTSAATTSAATTSSATTPEGDWWEYLGEPEHGGKITVEYHRDTGNFDTWGPMPWYVNNFGWYERPFQPDWTTDMEDFPFATRFIPEEYCAGALLETWEWKDDQTLVAKVRQGVKWQDKAPSYGRDFTAYDIQEHYDRALGLGEYAEDGANPWYLGDIAAIEGAQAIDESTIEIYFKTANPLANMTSLTSMTMANIIENPDTIEAGANDWENICGTGPFMLTGYVQGSEYTLTRNPDYWQYDPRYPDNQLPYVDEVTVVIVTDDHLKLAALRAGELDICKKLGTQDTESLRETDPDMQLVMHSDGGYGLELRCDQEPFDDIKVRKALQMAINFGDIAEGYYKGQVPTVPSGLLSHEYTGYYTPYEEWSESLQAEYTYNVEGAKALLAEANVPSGYEMECVASTSGDSDIELLQIIKSMFSEVGIELEPVTMDATIYAATKFAGKYDDMIMTKKVASTDAPEVLFPLYSLEYDALTYNNDATYAELVDKFLNSATAEEYRENCKACNQYYLEQHWVVLTPTQDLYTVLQPYIGNYSGQEITVGGSEAWWWAHLWVDSSKK